VRHNGDDPGGVRIDATAWSDAPQVSATQLQNPFEPVQNDAVTPKPLVKFL